MAAPVDRGPVRCELSESLAADFAQVYQEHARGIYYLALRLLGNPAQAEDAAHDVFLRAYRKFADFRREAAPRTWLYRITINHCQNLTRSWAHRNILTPGDDQLEAHAAKHAETPLRVLEVKELGDRIQATLDALPEEYRLLLLLVADERLSYEDAAELTQQSVDAVRGKLHRARKAFVAHFQRNA